MSVKYALLFLALFIAPLSAPAYDIQNKIEKEISILEKELGVKNKNLEPLKVPFVTPKKKGEKDTGRGPTAPLPAVEVGQDLPNLPNLTTISGEVDFSNIEKEKDFSSLWNKNSHLEILFFDTVSPSGIPHSSSKEVVPPLILPSGEKRFSIKVPKDGEGYIIAYVYYSEPGRSDIAIFSEEIIGLYQGKITIPKGGISNLKININKIKAVRAEHPFVTLSGWVHDEYQQSFGLSNTSISIVGTTIVAVTDRFGRYLFPRIPKLSRMILQVERRGYVATRIPLELGEEDLELDIFLSPVSKYSRAFTPSVPSWDSSKFGIIEGRLINGKSGLLVRISSVADGIIYLDRAGIPRNYITKNEWENGKFEEGSVENGDFVIINIEEGLSWIEVWDGSKKVYSEPLAIEPGVATRAYIDLDQVHGFAAKVLNSDYTPGSNIVVHSLSSEGKVDIQPVGFIQYDPEEKKNTWIETKNMGEFIFPDFSFGLGRTILETQKADYLTTLYSGKIGRNPKILIFPKDYFLSLIRTANSKIRRVNRSQFRKLEFFPEILPSSGIILVDVPSIPPKTIFECFGNQGATAYLGEGGEIDIYSSSSTTPEGDGRFMLYNLLPGEYTVAGYLEEALIFLETVLVKSGAITFISDS